MNNYEIVKKAKATLPENHVLLGWGETFKVDGGFSGFALNTSCGDPCWGFGPWLGNVEYILYAAPKDSEVAKLNGLSGDDEEPWQVVSEVGWPEEGDYPVWVYHPQLGIGFSMEPDSEFNQHVLTCDMRSLDAFCVSDDEDVTHWKRCNLKIPEPPKDNETVTINGKRYRKADVEDKLKELRPID